MDIHKTMPCSKEVQKKSDAKRNKNPERIEYMKTLQRQPHIVKKRMITTWKKRGVVHHDFDILYQSYLDATTCGRCNIQFKNDVKATSRCLDHDHTTGEFRSFLCNICNWTHMRQQRKPRL